MSPPLRRGLALACLLGPLLGPGSPVRAEEPAPDVARLRASLAADRARLIELIATPGEAPLADDPELRAIAERMARTEAALRAHARPGPEPR